MKSKKESKKIDGWINFKKEKGYSSAQVLAKIKKKFSLNKIGYLGTLDPLAEGVLPVAIGEATKTINYIKNKEKTYIFNLKWGEETDTDDSEGKVIKFSSIRPNKKNIEDTIKRFFLGSIRQKPPKFSAIKIKGNRAYKLAREGKDFDINDREVKIIQFDLLNNNDALQSEFKVKCTSGTYIRSLARDLANKLGTCGHATFINRIQDNFFKIDESLDLETLFGYNCYLFNKNILPLEFVLKDIMVVEIEDSYMKKLRDGKMIFLDDIENQASFSSETILVKCKGKLVSIAKYEKGYIIPRRNFNNQFGGKCDDNRR